MSRVKIDVNGNAAILRHAVRRAEKVTWRGRPALMLDGLAFLPEYELEEGTISVDIGAEGAAYCGIVFHGQDCMNFELAYVQPHTSGGWDALQYDPVFHGSNTWQLYYGPGAQKTARVPTGEWFTLEVAFDAQRALVRVGDQEPLVIPRLAHRVRSGFIGLWSYLPAYFSNLRVVPGSIGASSPQGAAVFPDNLTDGSTPGGRESEKWSPGLVEEWFLEGFGRVECEPGGVLNLNRYLPGTLSQARLVRRLVAEQKAELEVAFGFSDVLTLALDDRVLFEGEHLFARSPDWHKRGYVSLDRTLECTLSPGEHTLTATLLRNEPFGWGLIMGLQGAGVRLEPAVIG